MHHSAIVVSDLARSISFYEKFFDAEVELSFEAGGPDVAALHGLDESLFTMAMLSVGGGRIELFEYKEPTDRQDAIPRACDMGGTHIAFQIDEVAAKYDELRANGVEFTRPPLTVGDEHEGYVLAFCRDPDGHRIELIQIL
jgi:catechol 2,3-dioxygenase-like lactoylglutathione lyase family enzyme